MVGGQFLSLQSDAMRWPNGLRQAAAVCNSLTLIGKSKVVGELGERRAFNGVEAHFLVCAHSHSMHKGQGLCEGTASCVPLNSSHSLPHSLPHSLTHSVIHSFTQALTHSCLYTLQSCLFARLGSRVKVSTDVSMIVLMTMTVAGDLARPACTDYRITPQVTDFVGVLSRIIMW